jgi:proteic killer suppression protein
MIRTVILSKTTQRQLLKVPGFIRKKFIAWIAAIEEVGLEAVRMTPGFHDEPLKGRLEGFRSIRLNRSYRAYYRIVCDQVDIVYVERVDKHEY